MNGGLMCCASWNAEYGRICDKPPIFVTENGYVESKDSLATLQEALKDVWEYITITWISWQIRLGMGYTGDVYVVPLSTARA